MITLLDEFALIVHRDATERTRNAGSQTGLAGAVLMELVLRERIEIDLRSAVTVIDATPCGHAVVDASLAQINGDGQVRDAMHWLGIFQRHCLLKRLRPTLVDRGILDHQRVKVMRLFHINRYWPIDESVKKSARSRLARATVKHATRNPRTAALASVVYGAKQVARALPDHPIGPSFDGLHDVATNPPSTPQTQRLMANIQQSVIDSEITFRATRG